MPDILPIDLAFQDRPGIIAAYLIPYSKGAVLVESGPGSTLDHLQKGIRDLGLDPQAVTHVLLTHIHLDHAGAAGWFAGLGARVFVHPLGKPHLLDPSRLMASAQRIYGDKMDELWGRFYACPEGKVSEVKDGEEIVLGELAFKALHTPGHAEHHIAYLLDGTGFTGDVGGVRQAGTSSVRLPYVPPETHLARWRESLRRLAEAGLSRLAPTHFGIFDDASAHLGSALAMLDAVEAWLPVALADNPTGEEFRSRYVAWLQVYEHAAGVADGLLGSFDVAAPVYTAADGLYRYWQKHRSGA